MIIDYSKMQATEIDGFKGGKGPFIMRCHADESCKIMKNILPPGASTGMHKHEGNCEVIYVLSGRGTFHIDGIVEEALPGQVHYCPNGSSHYMENISDEDLVFFAVVPELR